MDDQDINQKIDTYIQSSIDDCLNSPAFSSLTEDQKNQKKEELKKYFDELIVKTLITNLNEAQINELENLNAESPEFEEKLSQFSSEIPGFAMIMDETFNKAVEQVKVQGSIPTI